MKRHQVNITLSEEEHQELLQLVETINNSLTIREKINKSVLAKQLYLVGLKSFKLDTDE